ncbi:hypothetical protein [Paracidovorax anthurii]|uniref:ATPase with chaperone activity n=1 Tax=Paracidovorax anthurii TaxID=78229 RepID=A0A328Z818_9BURK|nr:hypothetical protein [Paracidovorax anthurii]RAR81834.1 hypothetical protein AX018_101978 [Paracidovorax anthurii]WCM92161.1 hypothetical protein M5C99_17630 [Acidovorax sp. NCPPB 2350]
MHDDNQIHVPPSFIALYSDARQRLTAPAAEVRERHEFCEDLANHLVEQARVLYHVQAPSESEVLLRIHAGLASPGAGVTMAEARWITLRLAELLDWRCPELPAAGAPPAA